MASSEGYQPLTVHLTTLITTYPPPFIYVHDSISPRITASIIRSTLSQLQDDPNTDANLNVNLHLACAFVNAVACFTPRLFYDTVLNALAGWTPQWEEGCSNWTGPPEARGQRFNESLDAFLHGLSAVRASIGQGAVNGHKSNRTNGKGKGKARDVAGDCRLVLVVERAERLKETMPDLMVPLTRLAELSQVEITAIFISELPWEHIRPPLGAAPDPYFLEVPLPSKQDTLTRLASLYPASSDDKTYHPALRSLYSHFLSILYSICAPFTTDPDELAYIAAARWPGFVQPVLDAHQQQQEQLRAHHDDQEGNASDSEPEEIELAPPTEDTRIRLTRLFTPSFTSAFDALNPRLTSALAWCRANAPPPNLLSIHPRQVPSLAAQIVGGNEQIALSGLPRMAKFVLVAAFLASTNPAKTDLRMFGRGADERAKRRKRKGGTPRKGAGAKNAAVKIPQRLVGPMAFPLDRMLAILAVLLEECDVESRPPMPEYTVTGEYTETEISRVTLYAQVVELTSMHLLHRTSPADKLEMSPTFKCGISYDAALSLARDLEVPLNDLMWDPV